jgi:hypothetical protein
MPASPRTTWDREIASEEAVTHTDKFAAVVIPKAAGENVQIHVETLPQLEG